MNGGVFGPGASSKIQTLSTGGSTAQSLQEWLDLLEFHQFHAERGDSAYMFRLARLYYGGFGAGGLGGSRGRKNELRVTGKGVVNDGLWDGGRDFGRSSRWFMRLGRKYWIGDGKEALWNPAIRGPFNPRSSSTNNNSPVSKKEGKKEGGKLGYYDAKLDTKNEGTDEQTSIVSGLAAGYLGRMYLRGEGFNQNYHKAFLWFKRGSTKVRLISIQHIFRLQNH